MTEKKTNINPVALVTGGARRIGAAIVRQLHQIGYDVVVHYRHAEREAEALVFELNSARPGSACKLHMALERESDTRSLITSAYAWHSRLDVLVNNASVFFRTPVQETSSQEICDALWRTNVHVPYWLSEYAFPFLAQQRGVIINLTDIHAEKPIREYSIYCQTKAALHMQTLSLAKEYAPQVRVNAVAPGAILWPEGENMLDDGKKATIIEKTPMACHGAPVWVAQAVVALVENQFITGQTLKVDGGRSLG
jgi:pteridine reductase